MSVGPIHRSIICTFGFSNTKIWEATSEKRNTVIPTCRLATYFVLFASECHLLTLSQNHGKLCNVNIALINRQNFSTKNKRLRGVMGVPIAVQI
jgi:hypothetical protein